MKTTAATILGVTLALAPAILAQDQPETAAKQTMERMAQVKVVTASRWADGDQTFEFMGGQLIGGKTVKGAPYSAEAVTEITQTLPDGNHIVNRSSSTLYRDSEGRERREESFNKLGAWNSQGEPARAIFISDPVAKTNYTLDSKAHTASKMGSHLPLKSRIEGGGRGGAVTLRDFGMAHGATEQAVLVDDGPDMVYFNQKVTTDQSQSKVEQLGKRIIEGVQAEGTRTTVTIPAGQIGNERPIDIVSERWYSPELQMTMLSKHSDPRNGETVYKLTGVNRSEPQRTLFEVPADYTISETPMMRIRTLPNKEENQ
jgi:hypothetical protein